MSPLITFYFIYDKAAKHFKYGLAAWYFQIRIPYRTPDRVDAITQYLLHPSSKLHVVPPLEMFVETDTDMHMHVHIHEHLEV